MKTHTGFTLLEVLIAMLILAVGLLGLAALQTSNIRNNLAAYNRGQATQLLYDMSDRLRANRTVANNYLITNSSTDPRTKDKNVESPLHDCRDKTKTTCTPAALATYDLIEWNKAIIDTLPMGRGCVVSNDNVVFTLYITWDDNRSGDVTTDDAKFDTNNTCDFKSSKFTSYSASANSDPILSIGMDMGQQ